MKEYPEKVLNNKSKQRCMDTIKLDFLYESKSNSRKQLTRRLEHRTFGHQLSRGFLCTAEPRRFLEHHG